MCAQLPNIKKKHSWGICTSRKYIKRCVTASLTMKEALADLPHLNSGEFQYLGPLSLNKLDF